MDILVAVPPGTRVRYVESRHVDRPVCIDIAAIPGVIEGQAFQVSILDLPVFDAENFTLFPEEDAGDEAAVDGEPADG